MAYTLEQLTADCRSALASGSARPALDQVVGLVSKACLDRGFVAAHIGPDNHDERRILHEDEQLGFCIVAHVYRGAKESNPHDHGPSWAIYGQAEGETTMSDFRMLTPPSKTGTPGTVERVNTYTMKPGDAHLYDVGDLHAPERYSSTRLLRIEGMNMDNVKRDSYLLA